MAYSLYPIGTRRQTQRGFSILSVVAGLALIGFLYVAYTNLQLSDNTEKATAAATKTAGQQVACATNRQAIERASITWSLSHPGTEPTLQRLEGDGVIILPCPEGGQFRLQGKSVLCSMHSN